MRTATNIKMRLSITRMLCKLNCCNQNINLKFNINKRRSTQSRKRQKEHESLRIREQITSQVQKHHSVLLGRVGAAAVAAQLTLVKYFPWN